MRTKIAALALLASVSLARAQTPDFYVLKDQSSPQKTLQMGIFTFSGKSTPASVSSDTSGNPLSGTIGVNNPNGMALFVQGVTNGVPVQTSIVGSLPAFAATPTVNLGTIGGAATQTTLASILTALGLPFQAGASIGNTAFGINGTLPQFTSPAHFICDSGCSSSGGGAIFGPTASGSAAANPPVLLGGTSDGTATGTVGNLKVLGGLAFVNCSNCSGSGVSAQDQSAFVAGTSLLVPGGGVFNDALVALTSGQQAMQRLTSARGAHVNLRNATGTEIGTAGSPVRIDPTGTTTQPVTGTITANAGTNLNTSALALEGGGHLASIDTKTPALGQALAAASVPVVLTTAQLTTLTPPAAITGFALDTSVGATNTDIGAPGSIACVTDTSSCSINQLAQRLAQRLTTINTTLGTPFQAGGSIGNTSFAATQSGNWINRIVGNVGGVLDAIGQNVAAPANWLQAGCQFQTTPTTITATNGSPCQMDNSGNILVNVKNTPAVTLTSTTLSTPITDSKTSGTTLTTQNQNVAINTQGVGTVRFGISAIANAPTIMFECLDNQGGWQNVTAYGIGPANTPVPAGSTVNTNGTWRMDPTGYQQCRAIDHLNHCKPIRDD